jgi:hypothetical protein
VLKYLALQSTYYKYSYSEFFDMIKEEFVFFLSKKNKNPWKELVLVRATALCVHSFEFSNLTCSDFFIPRSQATTVNEYK